MKRILSVLLCFSIICALAGCKKQPQQSAPSTTDSSLGETQPTVPDNTESANPEIEIQIPDQEPMVAISLPVSENNTYTEDDVLLFSCKSQKMSLIVPEKEIEDKVILDFQNRLDSVTSSTQEIIARAKEKYSGNGNWSPYFYNILYRTTRIDLSVLSLYGIEISWSGGAHPTQYCTSANYDLMTGDVLTLGSILTHQDQLETLCSLLIDEVAEIKAEKFISPDYEDIIKKRFAQNESYNETWYFDEHGLNFYFSPYEIASYAAGIITVNIPYENLTGIIEDRYFPPEMDVATGTVRAIGQKDADLTKFTQIAEIVLDKDGEMIFLYTDLSVQNVSLEVGTWNSDRSEFIVDSAVFATPMLTPGDAAMIQTIIPESAPNVRLTYTTGNKTIVEYIARNNDGTILLLTEDAI